MLSGNLAKIPGEAWAGKIQGRAMEVGRAVVCVCVCVCVFIRACSNGNTCLFLILLMNCPGITKGHHKPIMICCVGAMH